MIHKRFSLLIGPNDVVCYDIALFPAFCQSIRGHFKRSLDTLFVGPSKNMFGPTKGRKLRNFVRHNVILTNQNTEYFVFHWLHYTHMQYNAWLASPHLLDQWTSIQALCRYFNFPVFACRFFLMHYTFKRVLNIM